MHARVTLHRKYKSPNSSFAKTPMNKCTLHRSLRFNQQPRPDISFTPAHSTGIGGKFFFICARVSQSQRPLVMIQSLLQPRTTLSEQSLSPLGRRGARDLRLLARAGGYLWGLAVEDYFRLFEIASGVWWYVNTRFKLWSFWRGR
jgi:hypothetical protein